MKADAAAGLSTGPGTGLAATSAAATSPTAQKLCVRRSTLIPASTATTSPTVPARPTTTQKLCIADRRSYPPLLPLGPQQLKNSTYADRHTYLPPLPQPPHSYLPPLPLPPLMSGSQSLRWLIWSLIITISSSSMLAFPSACQYHPSLTRCFLRPVGLTSKGLYLLV